MAGAARRDDLVAPFLTGRDGRVERMVERRWEGHVDPKPWQREVTATLAHLETPELVPVVVDLLRLQTADPHVIIVDTGSSVETCRKLERLRSPEVEIHYIRSHAYRHPSAPVSAACDLAMTLTTSPYLFMTHVDCFLRQRDFLARLAADCGPKVPVIGYRMSDRSFLRTEDWKWMVSHTATMIHMPTVRKARASWAIEIAHDAYGYDRPATPGGWPDTETAFNLTLKAGGIKPRFIGDETNYERHLDDEVDHCRSFPGSALYSDSYHSKAQRWIDVAVGEAKARAKEWRAGRDTPPDAPRSVPAPRKAVVRAAGGSERQPSVIRELVLRLPVKAGSEVTVEQGGGLADLFSDMTGAELANNPLRVRKDGEVRLFAGRGTYRVGYRDTTGRRATATARLG